MAPAGRPAARGARGLGVTAAAPLRARLSLCAARH